MSTPDPTEIETLIAQRYIESALAGLPQMWEDKFAALDAQAAPADPADDLWTLTPATHDGRGKDDWYVVPPKNDPHAAHPDKLWSFLTLPDGSRVIPISGRHNAQLIADHANTER